MSETKRIFISRRLASDSPIHKIAEGHNVTDQSLIYFSPLEFDPPETDWVFFYSRNAVRYFFEDTNLELYPYLYACLSEGTAEELSKYVLDISFIGKGSPDKIAQQFQEVRNPHESVSFIRANNSIDSIFNIIGSENALSIPVYDNQIINQVPTEDFDILIFTSPMNVDAWFGKNDYKEQEIIVIGNTTRNAVSRHVNRDVLVASEPSEEGIASILERIV